MRNIVLVPILGFLLAGCLEEDETKISIGENQAIIEPVEGKLLVSVPVTISKNEIGGFTLYVESESESAVNGVDFEIPISEFSVSKSEETVDILVNILSDDSFEGDESVQLTISTDDSDIEITTKSMNIEIEDATAMPTISLDLSQATFVEGTGEQKIEIKMSNVFQDHEMTVPIITSGTATKAINDIPGDYSLNTEIVSIAAGDSKGSVTLSVLEDTLKEGGETIFLKLGSPSLGVLGEIPEIAIIIPGDVSLNDTGVTQFYSDEGVTEQSSLDYPSQDAGSGLDFLNKEIFDGHAAFSFTKLDGAGNALPSNTMNYSCVLDERTGLIWEAKGGESIIPTPDGDLTFEEFIQEAVAKSELDSEDEEYQPYPYHSQHSEWQSQSYTYYWNNEDAGLNGGASGALGPDMTISGYPIGASCAYPNKNMINFVDSSKNCNSNTYTNMVNTLGVCGFKTWRLPTIEELRSIASYRSEGSRFDDEFFGDSIGYGKYLSSTPNSGAYASVWCLDGNDGSAKLCNKQTPNYVRLVRSNN